jgi:hypothetical protein
MFGGSATGAGPCVLEPEDGTMFPNNWLRPRVRWSSATPGAVTQIRIRSEAQERELVAYTTRDSWVMPANIWKNLALHVRERDITVTVRQAAGATTVKFSIAAVPAGGNMVFWAANPAEVGKDPKAPGVEMDSELRGFAVGDEGTTSVLKIPQVQQGSREDSGAPRKVRCIGCHVATPDNAYVAFTDHWPWNSVIAGVKPEVTGQALPGMSQSGVAQLNLPWGGMMTFSKAHWQPGRRLAVISSSMSNPQQPYGPPDNKKPARLLWYNLDAAGALASGNLPAMGTQYGVIARNGDARGAACPVFSADGMTLLYASTAGNQDGRLAKGATDLFTVPFNGGMGGDARPLAGAADPASEEYYPAYSPDDRYVVYNRVAAGQDMYANPSAELFVVPGRGGQAARLRANDPPACSGRRSPGINNHWAKWSPSVQNANGRTYYWLIFSSNRSEIPPVKARISGQSVQVSQLYVTLLIQNGEAGIQSFPAIYLWNQPTNTLNTTPVWESLTIPRVVN